MSYQVIFAALKPDVTDAVIDAAKECGIKHFEFGGGALYQAPYFYV